jgi:hypothetical protein
VLATPVPDSATVSGLPGALLLTDSVPVAAPAAVGANVTPTVQEAPAASDVPQLFDSPNGPVTPIDDIDAAAVPEFDTVTDCDELVEPTFSLPNDSLDGDAVRAVPVGPVPPPPGKTSNSDSCAAVQPVLPVKLSSTYRSLVPDGRLIVAVLPVDGLKVYPADPTSWLNVVSLVLPRTDSVSVRVLQADDGGRSSVTDPMDCPVGAGVAVGDVGGHVGLVVAARRDRLVEGDVGGGGDAGAG